jgi:integrase
MRGNITRRGKTSWRLKFDVPSTDGRRTTHYETVRGTKGKAQQRLAELLSSIGKGTYVAPNNLVVTAHVRARIDVWHEAGDIGDATRARYDVLLKKQITPHIGGVALQRLGTADIEKWHATLRTNGLSPRTAKHAHALLSKALGDAVRHGLLARNVCGRDGQRSPKIPTKEMQILTADQVGDVVGQLRGHPLFAKAMVALFCGLRAGEVLALGWRHIDLDGKVLHVRQSVEEIAGLPLAIKVPKTAAGIRKLTMPDIVVEALRDHRRQQLELRMAMGLGKLPEDALVFAAIDGGPSRRTALSIAWGESVDALGLPDVVFHSLRHTHASQLIAAKVDVVTISKRMGHANPAITLKVYAHLFEQTDSAAAEAINAALGATSVPKNG